MSSLSDAVKAAKAKRKYAIASGTLVPKTRTKSKDGRKLFRVNIYYPVVYEVGTYEYIRAANAEEAKKAALKQFQQRSSAQKIELCVEGACGLPPYGKVGPPTVRFVQEKARVNLTKVQRNVLERLAEGWHLHVNNYSSASGWLAHPSDTTGWPTKDTVSVTKPTMRFLWGLGLLITPESLMDTTEQSAQKALGTFPESGVLILNPGKLEEHRIRLKGKEVK